MDGGQKSIQQIDFIGELRKIDANDNATVNACLNKFRKIQTKLFIKCNSVKNNCNLLRSES